MSARIDPASSTSPMAADTHAATATDSEAAARGTRWIGRLVRVNLGLVILQALTAGLFLSGYGRALTVHAAVAQALLLGALVQAVTAVVLWRRRRVPAALAGVSLGLLAGVLLQIGLGYRGVNWLHVPIGVGLFGGLMRQASLLDTLRRTSAARS